ncbi:MAG: CPBP family intramembrane glutamic endopeptidase [Polyangiales bacterium]
MNRSRLSVAAAVYGVFALVALAWRHADGASALHDGAPLGGTHAFALPLSASLGALTGVAAGAVSRALARGPRWGRGLYLALRDTLAGGPSDAASLAALTIAAAVGEELLFRGAMLPALRAHHGAVFAVAVSSAAFGLLHAPWSRRMLPWTLMATAMGVVFALLYLATGEVLAPVMAHAVVNYENLGFLIDRSARPPG